MLREASKRQRLVNVNQRTFHAILGGTRLCRQVGLPDGLQSVVGSQLWAAMSSHVIDIHRIATLSRLKLTPEEAVSYESQLSKILDHMDVLSRYDLEGVEPSAHAMPVYDVWREDASRPGFTAEQALSNAPRRTSDQFMIGKVVE